MPKTGPKQNDPNRFKNIPINFTHRQVEVLDELAEQRKETRSEVVRDAVRFYIENLDKADQDIRESELTREVARIEKRLSSLMIKMLRVSGQNLYWATLPWVDGPPKARINQEGFNMHWEKASAFSATILRSSRKGGAQEEEPETRPTLDEK
jgi:hypothetical protein